MNIEQARFNMVEQQIRPWDVLNTTILDLLYTVRREDFVPSPWRSLAFVDMELPLEHGEHMLSPKLEARLIQELHLQPTDWVLEVGTGSGYMAALMSRLAHCVTTIEIHPDLAAAAKKKLSSYKSVTVEVADAARGWMSEQLWDAIVITGSLPTVPQAFFDLLAPGGRLIAIVGDAPAMKATRWVKSVDGLSTPAQVLFETVVPPLHNAAQPERFTF